MTTAHKRTAITIQFAPGKDDDLLDCIRILANGNRNTELKNTLRRGFKLPETTDRLDQLEAMQAKIDYVCTALEDMPGWFDDRLATALRETTNALQDALTRITVSGPSENGNGHQAPPIDDAPRLTAEEKARRANKMSKANW